MKNKKEETFIELMGDYSIITYKYGKLESVVYFVKPQNILFLIEHETNTNFVFISFDRIWLPIMKKYNMGRDEMEKFLKDMLLKFFKIKVAKLYIDNFSMQIFYKTKMYLNLSR